MKTNPDALAFPIAARDAQEFYQGLTKREYFAVSVLRGLMTTGVNNCPEEAAALSARHADALISELNRGQR